MIYVFRLIFWARLINSFSGSWYHCYTACESPDPWKALLPYYQTVEHIHLKESEIICEISVDNPLDLD